MAINLGRAAMCVLGGSALIVSAVLVLAPQGARASCAAWKPREYLAKSNAAFVGSFVERNGDVLVYAVDESVKGGLGPRVEVRDEAPGVTSIGNLPATPGEQIAMFLRRDAAGGFVANGCSTVPPAALKTAAASGQRRCLAPSIRRVRVRRGRFGRGVHLRLTVRDSDGSVSSVRVSWGDGSTTRTSLKHSSSRQRNVAMRHVYRSRGRRRIEVVAASRTNIDCWIRGIAAVPERSRPVRITT